MGWVRDKGSTCKVSNPPVFFADSPFAQGGLLGGATADGSARKVSTLSASLRSAPFPAGDGPPLSASQTFPPHAGESPQGEGFGGPTGSGSARYASTSSVAAIAAPPSPQGEGFKRPAFGACGCPAQSACAKLAKLHRAITVFLDNPLKNLYNRLRKYIILR